MELIRFPLIVCWSISALASFPLILIPTTRCSSLLPDVWVFGGGCCIFFLIFWAAVVTAGAGEPSCVEMLPALDCMWLFRFFFRGHRYARRPVKCWFMHVLG